jgi:hypothetical protein
LKIFFVTLWVVWLQLPAKYGLSAMIWILPCAEYPAILFKTITAYIRINRNDLPLLYPDDEPYHIGKITLIRDGKDAVVFACGVKDLGQRDDGVLTDERYVQHPRASFSTGMVRPEANSSRSTICPPSFQLLRKGSGNNLSQGLM